MKETNTYNIFSIDNIFDIFNHFSIVIALTQKAWQAPNVYSCFSYLFPFLLCSRKHLAIRSPCAVRTPWYCPRYPTH